MLDKSKKENSQKDPMTEVFGEPIDVYSTEQAIKDGILFDAGQKIYVDDNGVTITLMLPED